MTRDTKLEIREWINEDQESEARFLARVSVDCWDENKDRFDVSASLTIADCSRSITLDFGGDGPYKLNDDDNFDYLRRCLTARRAKLNKLDAMWTQFYEACRKAYDEIEARYPEKKS